MKYLWIPILMLPGLLWANGLAESSDIEPAPPVTDERIEPRPLTPEETWTYREVILRTEAMVQNQQVRDAAAVWGMDVLNVTWEDTGRYADSSVGPNISDMTIQMQWENPEDGSTELHLMPVIRFPNFSDVTGDIPSGAFSMKVGNNTGSTLEDISLKEFLKDPSLALTDTGSWDGGPKSLYVNSRDSHVLVSAQACFLPVPKDGLATFNPVLFNYQSVQDDPAVLTLLVTREGSSVTIIDNVRDSFDDGWSWGQRLFHNENGEKASLTGRRLSDFLEDTVGSNDALKPEETNEIAKDNEGLNMVLLVQVPLKQRNPDRGAFYYGDEMLYAESEAFSMAAVRGGSDVEEAVIGHGELEGPFIEIDGQKIKRDPRFPVRVTVQFYKATSNGIVSEADMAEIARQIATVYAQADYVGSLVTGDRSGRPTDWEGDHSEPPYWWDDFWARHWMNTGLTREDTISLLQEQFGSTWLAPNDLQQMEESVASIL